jgi:hypothetical protein
MEILLRFNTIFLHVNITEWIFTISVRPHLNGVVIGHDEIIIIDVSFVLVVAHLLFVCSD